ncbi:MAG: heme-binding protein [Burkholderiales bacterium]|jgi:hypothetical protein|nr:heme-binding protein [Burkholderiales bacterium]
MISISRGLRALALLLAGSLAPLGSAMAIEEAPFKTLVADGPFEIREYAPYLVAETYVEGGFGEVGNEGFRRLFRYISGDNAKAASIAMTAPVEQSAASEKIAMTAPVEQQKVGARWRIAFVLPASYTLATAPKPLDPRVTVVEMPARRMASVRYSGTWSEARYDEQLAALAKFVTDRGLSPEGEPVFARYDPPFMPWFLRRNEIVVPVGRTP